MEISGPIFLMGRAGLGVFVGAGVAVGAGMSVDVAVAVEAVFPPRLIPCARADDRTVGGHRQPLDEVLHPLEAAAEAVADPRRSVPQELPPAVPGAASRPLQHPREQEDRACHPQRRST